MENRFSPYFAYQTDYPYVQVPAGVTYPGNSIFAVKGLGIDFKSPYTWILGGAGAAVAAVVTYFTVLGAKGKKRPLWKRAGIPGAAGVAGFLLVNMLYNLVMKK